MNVAAGRALLQASMIAVMPGIKQRRKVAHDQGSSGFRYNLPECGDRVLNTLALSSMTCWKVRLGLMCDCRLGRYGERLTGHMMAVGCGQSSTSSMRRYLAGCGHTSISHSRS